MVDLETPRMPALGPLYNRGFYNNYLHGLDHLCERYVKKQTRILELGSYHGASTRVFIEHSDRVTCVDIQQYPQMNDILPALEEFVISDSCDFLKSIEVGAYDLIYIDTTHEYQKTLEEVQLSWEKLLPGQFLSGHDYTHLGVHEALLHFFQYPKVNVFLDTSWLIEKTY